MHIVEQKEGGHLLSAGNNTQSNQMAMEQVVRGPSHSVEGRNVREISFRQQSCPDNNTPQRNELTGTGGSVSHVNLQIVADQPLHIQRSVKFEPILVFSELSNYQKQSQMDLSPWALTAPQTSPSSHYQPIIPVITNYPTCEQTLGPKPKRQFSILNIEDQPPNKKSKAHITQPSLKLHPLYPKPNFSDPSTKHDTPLTLNKNRKASLKKLARDKPKAMSSFKNQVSCTKSTIPYGGQATEFYSDESSLDGCNSEVMSSSPISVQMAEEAGLSRHENFFLELSGCW